MSNETLVSVEAQITLKFAEFFEVARTDDLDAVAAAAKVDVIMIENRNKN